MKINITSDDVADKEILRGFALATGWTAASPLTKKEWMAKKVTAYIVQTARRGYCSEASNSKRVEFVAAFNAASTSAQTLIREPTSG